MTGDPWGAARARGGRRLKRRAGWGAAALVTAEMFLLVGGIGSASAQLPSNGFIEELDYSVSNVQPIEFPGVLYTGESTAAPGAALKSNPVKFDWPSSCPTPGR